jgi:hypothetical protein
MSLLQQIVERGDKDSTVGERLSMFIKQKGFVLLGYGANARVYGRKGSPYVIKIYRNDPCYEKFIAFIAKNDNPHFPKVLSQPVSISNADRMVKLEALSELRDAKTIEMVKHISSGFIQYYDLKPREGQDTRDYDQRIAQWMETAKQHPKLIEAIKLLHDNFSGGGCFIDLGSQNLMQRSDGTVVLVDPTFPMRNLNESTDIDPVNGSLNEAQTYFGGFAAQPDRSMTQKYMRGWCAYFALAMNTVKGLPIIYYGEHVANQTTDGFADIRGVMSPDQFKDGLMGADVEKVSASELIGDMNTGRFKSGFFDEKELKKAERLVRGLKITLNEGFDRMASFVRLDEIPHDYRSKYPVIGRGTTSIALDRGKDVLIFTRDRMKSDWLQSQDLATQVARYESWHKSIPNMSDYDIIVLAMPKLYPLSPENKKRIVKLCRDFEDHYHSTAQKRESGPYQIPAKLWPEFVKFASKEKIFKNLFRFIQDYSQDQYTWDIRQANFMQTARGRVVVLDPIVCKSLMNTFFNHRRNSYS